MDNACEGTYLVDKRFLVSLVPFSEGGYSFSVLKRQGADAFDLLDSGIMDDAADLHTAFAEVAKLCSINYQLGVKRVLSGGYSVESFEELLEMIDGFEDIDVNYFRNFIIK